MRNGFHGDSKSFLGSIKTTRKSSQAVLPVFFRQAEGCIVTWNAYDTIVELNPQVGKELVPIASSPLVITSIGVLRDDYEERFGAFVTGELIRLHMDPQGKQILLLFQKGRLVSCRNEYLSSVAAMLKEHADLRMKTAKGP
jgi:hypothetical protein